ncbi:MAG: hypothetical protein AUJ49_08885 [Desulfovibrionaceae bacterium CG1_02_65_16]|nr:MAG: hypothetical protein AUJ49_08885 [Desulfovibrionaceae bacterium CG1_02_65_16]
MTRFAAVVLSAGKSSRLPRFKPLLHLGGRSLLGRAAELFQGCGVAEILAVTGCRAGEVEAEATACGMRPVFNPRHEDGMFTSVQAGLAALTPGFEAVFVLPVDIPLVRPTSVAALCARLETSTAQVLLPSFLGEPGHPPLLRPEAVAHALSWSGGGGLAAALEQLPMETVPVADAQILFDVDDDNAFAEAERRLLRLEAPTPDEALALLRLRGVAERGLAHGRGVADAALALAGALNARGATLDLALVEAAGLLHDIAKGQPKHEAAGARILADLGFARLAEIVAAHRDIDPAEAPVLTERELVYLADKLVRGPVRMPIRQRFQEKLDHFAEDAEACAAIRRRLGHALSMQARVEAQCGKNVQDLLGIRQ